MKRITLSQAIEGFLLEKQAQRLSPNTIYDYTNGFRKLQSFLGDPIFAEITLDQLRKFMIDLAQPHTSAGVAPRAKKVLSKKSSLNIHIALSALWTWAVTEGITKRHATERAEERIDQELFMSRDERPLSRSALLQLTHRLGHRAGVPDCHPHRFRHTFAINFLRNGGNAYELQMALGHSTLEMVKTYLSLAHADLAAAHKRASPVAHWRL